MMRSTGAFSMKPQGKCACFLVSTYCNSNTLVSIDVCLLFQSCECELTQSQLKIAARLLHIIAPDSVILKRVLHDPSIAAVDTSLATPTAVSWQHCLSSPGNARCISEIQDKVFGERYDVKLQKMRA
eukprot:4463940-Amphidinium_carterae.1